jgi:hypothetical protein
MLFDVRLLAFEEGTQDPVDALVRVFRMRDRAAQHLLSRLPYVVKRDLPLESAQRLVAALERIGGRVELVVAASHATPVEASALAPSGHAAKAPLHAPAAEVRGLDASREQAESRRRAGPRDAAPQALIAKEPLPFSAQASAEDDSLEADIFPPSRTSMSVRPTLAEGDESAPPQPAMPPVAPPGGPTALARAPAAKAGVRSLELPPLSRASPPKAAPAAERASRVHAGARPTAPAPLRGVEALPNARVSDNAQGARRSTAERTSAAQARAVSPQLPSEAAEPASTMRAISPPHAGAGVGRPSVVTPIAKERLSAERSSAMPFGSRSTGEIAAPSGRRGLPTFAVHGPPVDVRACAISGARKARALALLSFVVLGLVSLGAFFLLYLGALTVSAFRRRRTLSRLRMSALCVGANQLPELSACLKQFTLRLGLNRAPKLYVVAHEPKGLGSVACGRELSLWLDEPTLRRWCDDPKHEGLSFLIAHELGRFALGQARPVHRALARLSPGLELMDSISADAVAAVLVPDRAAARAALLSGLGSRELTAELDLDELDRAMAAAVREPPGFLWRVAQKSDHRLARLYHQQRGYR